MRNTKLYETWHPHFTSIKLPDINIPSFFTSQLYSRIYKCMHTSAHRYAQAWYFQFLCLCLYFSLYKKSVSKVGFFNQLCIHEESLESFYMFSKYNSMVLVLLKVFNCWFFFYVMFYSIMIYNWWPSNSEFYIKVHLICLNHFTSIWSNVRRLCGFEAKFKIMPQNN